MKTPQGLLLTHWVKFEPWKDPPGHGSSRYFSVLAATEVARDELRTTPCFTERSRHDPWQEYDAAWDEGKVVLWYREGGETPFFDGESVRGAVPFPPQHPDNPALLYGFSRRMHSEQIPKEPWQWRLLAPRGETREVLFGSSIQGELWARVIDGPLPLEGSTLVAKQAHSPCPFRAENGGLGLLYLESHPPPDLPAPSIGFPGTFRYILSPLEGTPGMYRRRPPRVGAAMLREGKSVAELSAGEPRPLLASWTPERMHLWQDDGGILWLLMIVRDGPYYPNAGDVYSYQGLLSRSRDLGKTWKPPKQPVFSGAWHDVSADVAALDGKLYVAYAVMDKDGRTRLFLRTEAAAPWLKDDEDEKDGKSGK